MRFNNAGRGLAYKTYKASNACRVRVQRSSAVGEYIWLCIDQDDPSNLGIGSSSPHMTAAQARRVARALLAFADGEDLR